MWCGIHLMDSARPALNPALTVALWAFDWQIQIKRKQMNYSLQCRQQLFKAVRVQLLSSVGLFVNSNWMIQTRCNVDWKPFFLDVLKLNKSRQSYIHTHISNSILRAQRSVELSSLIIFIQNHGRLYRITLVQNESLLFQWHTCPSLHIYIYRAG